FKSGWNDAAGNDIGHRQAGCVDTGEAGHDDLRTRRLGNQAYRDLGHDAQHAFGTNEGGQQVEPGAIGRARTQFDHLAIDGDHANLQYVVYGQSILQAVDAAGIFSDVSAYGTGNLAGRIG